MRSVRTRLFGLPLLGFAVLTAACIQLRVGPAAPRPNVVVAQANAPSDLLLAPGVADQFTTPKTGSVSPVEVRGWKSTLQAGFHNAYPTPGPSGRKLEITTAELSFAPAAVSSQGGAVAVIAQIRFKARLLDPAGQEIAAVAGTVEARAANTSPREQGMTDNASKAVEALYEKLTGELLNKQPAAAPTPVGAPGKSI